MEEEVLSPLYKSSDLANGREASRFFPLYQIDLSGPRSDLQSRWPKLAAYLSAHKNQLDARKSRIYSGKPPTCCSGSARTPRRRTRSPCQAYTSNRSFGFSSRNARLPHR